MLRRPLVVALLAAAVTACATPTAPCSRAEDLVKTPLTTASGDTILYVYTCGARLP